MRFVRFCACAALISAACGGRRDPPTISLTVSPATVTVDAGGSQRFIARVTGADLPVAWSLAEGPAAGTIAADGTYSAPMAAGTYHVIARAGGLNAAAAITVPAVAISIASPSANVTSGGSLQLQATVAGAADTGVLWSMGED